MDGTPKPKLQFGVRTLLELVAVVAVVLAFLYGRQPSRDAGRYQMTAVGQELFVLDSATGKVWTRWTSTNTWVEWSPGLPDRDLK